jgi:hypothetical protein
MFTKKVGVLDHGPFQRLKNNAPRAKSVGKRVAVDEFIVGENEASRNRCQAPRSAQHFGTLPIR